MLKIKNLSSSQIESNCYYIDNGLDAILIDPSVSPNALSQSDKEKLSAVLLTHSHVDHMFQIDAYEKLGIPIYVSRDDALGFWDTDYNVSELFGFSFTYKGNYHAIDTNELSFGSMNIEVLPTPGHTKGHNCYLIENSLFSGDLIFAYGSYGRFDFPTGDEKTLFSSIRKVLLLEDKDVYPGHGPKTTILKEKIYY